MVNADLNHIQAGPRVDRACYTDPSIFQMELSSIFEKTWLCIGHSSELRKAGDFRRAEMAGQPVLIVRGDDQAIRVLHNSCRHRGTLVELAARGNAEGFRCIYHHWEYGLDGSLRGVPRAEGYGHGFDKSELGLVPVPRVEVFENLIFASLNPDCAPLSEYLGELAPYLAYVASYHDQPQVSIGYFEYLVNANWKLVWENSQDDYHAEYLHMQAFAQRAQVFRMGTSQGILEVEGTRSSKALGMHGVLEQVDAASTLTIQQHRPRRVYTGVFPNMVALYHPLWDVTGLRILQPIAVDRTRVVTYCLGPASDSDQEARSRAERYHYSWGPGGRAGVDDIMVLEHVQAGLRAKQGGQVLFTRGGEKEAHGGPADENSCRALWNGWRHYMQGEALADARPEPAAGRTSTGAENAR